MAASLDTALIPFVPVNHLKSPFFGSFFWRDSKNKLLRTSNEGYTVSHSNVTCIGYNGFPTRNGTWKREDKFSGTRAPGTATEVDRSDPSGGRNETVENSAQLAEVSAKVNTGKALVWNQSQTVNESEHARRAEYGSLRDEQCSEVPVAETSSRSRQRGRNEHPVEALAHNEKISGDVQVVSSVERPSLRALKESRKKAGGLRPSKGKYVPSHVYLNDPKMPRQKEHESEQTSNTRRKMGGSHAYSVPHLVQQIMALKPYEDIDRVLNHWEGRAERKNFATLISALVKTGDVRRTMKVFDWMKNQRCYRARNDIYAMVMRLLARHRQLSQVRHLFGEMQEWRLKPDVDCYTAVLAAHGRVGDWKGGIDTFDEMLRNEVPPSNSSYNALISTCGVCGELEAALEMFARMKNDGLAPDVVTYNTLIAACKHAGHLERALEFYEELKALHFKPTRVTLNIIMSCLTRMGHLNEALEIYKGILHSRETWKIEPPLRIVHHNIAMHAYAVLGQVDAAREVFDQLVGEGITPTAISYNTLMGAYASTGDVAATWQIFDKMRAAELEPDVVSYASLLKALARARQVDPERGLEVMDLMRRRGCRPNQVIYNSLIHIMGLAGRLSQAEDLKDEMERVGWAPTTVTFSSMIMASRHSGLPERGQDFAQEALLRGIPLNAPIVNSLIGAHFCGDQPEAAMQTVEAMPDAGISPDHVTYTMLMHEAGAHGRFKEAQEAFDAMLAAGLTVSVEAGTALVNAYAKQGMHEHARRALEAMAASGCSPNKWTYNALVDACGRAGAPDDARRAFDEMVTAGIAPDVYNFSTLMRALNGSARFHQALSVGLDMRAGGVPPNKVACNEFLTACGRLKKGREGLEFFQDFVAQLEEGSQKVPTRTYILLFDALGGSRLPQEIAKVWRQLLESGVEPSENLYNAVLKAYCRSDNWQGCLQVLEEMKRTGTVGRIFTYNMVLKVLAQAGTWQHALDTIAQMEEAGCHPDQTSFLTVIAVLRRNGQLALANEFQKRLRQVIRGNAERDEHGTGMSMSKGELPEDDHSVLLG